MDEGINLIVLNVANVVMLVLYMVGTQHYFDGLKRKEKSEQVGLKIIFAAIMIVMNLMVVWNWFIILWVAEIISDFVMLIRLMTRRERKKIFF
jgi:uncharacterized membrane protein